MTTAAPTKPAINTYRILKLSRTVILALDGLLLIAILIGARVHREAIQTIGEDAAPSIIAAQHIKAALADMDADEANELLAAPNTANASTAGTIDRRVEAEGELLKAAGNITYQAEREPIRTLQITGGVYNRLAQEAEDFHDGSKSEDPHDPGNLEAVRYYNGAAFAMDGTLLPAADDLDKANNEELDRTFNSGGFVLGLSTAFVILAGLASLIALIGIQIFLSARTHRTLNPLLFIASVAALSLLAYSLTAMGMEQHQLKIAKQDAFQSIHALWRARAVAYSANAEESRYLLDPDQAEKYQNAFFAKSHALVGLPPGLSLDNVIVRLNAKEEVPGFTGYLADELGNITFPGERDATLKALSAYSAYLNIDTEIRTIEANSRRMEANGQHAEAIAEHRHAVNLCIGNAPNESNYAFDLFDKALGQAIDINQAEFDKSVDAGLAAVGVLPPHWGLTDLFSTLEAKALLAAILIALLAFFGFAPRIKEYE